MPVSAPSHIIKLIYFLLTISPLAGIGQPIQWDGGGGDGWWNNPQNWSGDHLPQPGDDVLLDHAFIAADYKVSLPAGNEAVSIHSIRISPSNGYTIQLELPKSNTAAPAFSTLGTPGIMLGNGAIFINASGAASGNAVVVSDSLRISAGGRFIQQSETAHATLVGKLSVAAETAGGCFEFNVPGSTSYTISASNRTYGHLWINASAAGGSKTYLSSGSNPLVVRGDFLLGPGATYALNLSGLLSIGQHARVKGTLNLSSGTRSNKMRVEGNLDCSGIITETGSGEPQVEFAGPSLQQWQQTGSLLNSIVVRMNTISGVQLQTPVRLSHKLILLAGALQTSAENLLTLTPGCLLEYDSTNLGAWVNGPLQRLGLSGSGYFGFPVGKQDHLRWLALHQVKGDVTVEYFGTNPKERSSQLGQGIDQLTENEYWAITATDLVGSFVELSFEANFSSAISTWNLIRVATLQQGIWENLGSQQLFGSGTGPGSVVSMPFTVSGDSPQYVTLATGKNGQQTLPLQGVSITIIHKRNGWFIEGCAAPGTVYTKMAVEASADGVVFKPSTLEQSDRGLSHICQVITLDSALQPYYRIAGTTAAGVEHFSAIVASRHYPAPLQVSRIWPNPATTQVSVNLLIPHPGFVSGRLYDLNGRLVRQYSFSRHEGNASMLFNLEGLPAGVYSLTVEGGGVHSIPQKLIKY